MFIQEQSTHLGQAPLGVQVPESEPILLCLWTSTWLLSMCSCMCPGEYLLAPGGPAVSGTPGHPGSPQILRLESRVLELELHGNGACQGHRVQPMANLGQHQVPPLEVSGEPQA